MGGKGEQGKQSQENFRRFLDSGELEDNEVTVRRDTLIAQFLLLLYIGRARILVEHVYAGCVLYW